MGVFLNEDHLPKAKDKLTPIRGGSVGINNILGYFKDHATSQRYPQWNLFLINAFTLSRNVYRKNISHSEFYGDLVSEIRILVLYIQTYLSYFPNQNKQYPVIIYFPNYSNIPNHVRKPLNTTDQTLVTFYEKSVDGVFAIFKQHSVMDHIKLIFTKVGDKRNLPYTVLDKGIRSLALSQNDNTMYKYGDPIFLLTHCVMDLYLSKKMINVELMESYNAVVKKPKEFGTKIIKEIHIPFIWILHRLFGDNTHISPYSKKDRRKFITMAQSNKWGIKTDDQILRDILRELQITKQQYLDYTP